MKIEVDISDLSKLFNCIAENVDFHTHRDKMNACVHKSKEVIYSPLTSETIRAKERLAKILDA